MQSKPLELIFDAIHRGKYDFQDFLDGDLTSNCTPVQIKKRTVYRPDKKLKAYLVFLNTFVFEHLELNDRVVYSYRKGVNPNAVAHVHATSRAFFQADIENFFESINRTHAKNIVISQINRVPVSDLHIYIERILDLTTINGVLPVGFPTSPLISNVCLTPFDNDLESYCRSSDLVYTRYADDIVVSAKSREALRDVESKLNDLLTYHFSGHLKFNRAKRKLTTIGRKTKIMGMVILPNGKVTIDMELKKKVEVLLHFYVRNRTSFIDMSGGDLGAGVQKLSGYITYINTADKSYLEKLRRKFGTAVVDSFLHRSA